jgi:hypothetical protein
MNFAHQMVQNLCPRCGCQLRMFFPLTHLPVPAACEGFDHKNQTPCGWTGWAVWLLPSPEAPAEGQKTS